MSTLAAGGLAVASYLVGGIPFALILGRWKGVDVRLHGSGNVGATNIGRVLGRRYAVVTFFLDAAKGALPALGAGLLWARLGWDGRRSAMALCGAGAIAGHVWPVYLGFRGGKGVATTIGVAAVLSWQATAIGLGVWLFGTYVLRYVFLGSMLFAASLPVTYLLLPGGVETSTERAAVAGLFVALALLVGVRHRSNIRRFLAGTEDRTGEKIHEAFPDDGNEEERT